MCSMISRVFNTATSHFIMFPDTFDNVNHVLHQIDRFKSVVFRQQTEKGANVVYSCETNLFSNINTCTYTNIKGIKDGNEICGFFVCSSV